VNDPKTIGAVVGGSIRRLREARHRTQDDVARAARSAGIRWNSSRVAALERGEKPIALSDLLELKAVLDLAGVEGVTWSDLFDSDDVVSFPHGWVAAREIGKALSGQPSELDPNRVRLMMSIREKTQHFTGGEAERKAARRLGVDVRTVLDTSMALWQRSLTAERNARLQAALPDGGEPRTVQARRGHITRQLVAALEERLAEGRSDG
jgi:transcriptional regulator with XRE-family HTH domain